jgi:predicted acetyltransferase
MDVYDRTVPLLVPPTTDLHASFLAAMAEFRAEGRGGPDDATMIGSDHRAWFPRWDTPEAFARYVAEVLADADDPVPPRSTPRPDGRVPQTTLWWRDGPEYLGRVGIRHHLTPALRERGGHIGYDVRPSARRQGHAAAMLRAALPVARDLGLDRVLLTTDADNVASQRVILANGGEAVPGTHHYWISLRG